MSKFNSIIIWTLLSIIPFTVKGQKAIPLYKKGKIPGAIKTKILNDTVYGQSWLTGKDTTIIRPKTIMPTLTIYTPGKGKSNGTAVIICSGGSYRNVADYQEGFPAAEKLAAAGITAFVLHYRVPRNDLMKNKEIAPLQDVQMAIQYVREHAAKYQINNNRLGIMGFSAGGHLVSTVGTHPHDIYISNKGKINLKPDFMILVYPVISFSDSLTHLLSRQNLIGPNITPEKVHKYSNELHVDANTPPTFIIHSIDDDIVKVENTLQFYAALNQAHVPAEIFLYRNGGHGYGITNKTTQQQWTAPCINWILTDKWQNQETFLPSSK